MIIDSLSLFADRQDLTGLAVGPHLIGNQIDTGIAGDLDVPELFLTVIATTAITAAGAGTLQFKLTTDLTPAIRTDGTALDEFATAAYPVGAGISAIPAGSILFQGELPANVGTYSPNRRYLGLLAIVAGNAITSGTVSAFLSATAGRWAPTAVPVN